MQSNKDANTLKREFLKKWSNMDPKIEATYAQFEIFNELDLKSFWGFFKKTNL
jgi:hypothetical protein